MAAKRDIAGRMSESEGTPITTAKDQKKNLVDQDNGNDQAKAQEESRFKPESESGSGIIDIEEARNLIIKEKIVKKTKDILARFELKLDKFYDVSMAFKSLKLQAKEDRIAVLVQLIWENALANPSTVIAYANLIKAIYDRLLGQYQKGRKKVTPEQVQMSQSNSRMFRKQILDKCQAEFVSGPEEFMKLKELEEKTLKDVDEDKREEMKLDFEKKWESQRNRRLANMGIIAEFYNLAMLSPKIMVNCIDGLLENQDEGSYESLYILLTKIGQSLEAQLKKLEEQALLAGTTNRVPVPRYIPPTKFMDKTFDRLRILSQDENLSARLRSDLWTVIEMRTRGWTSLENLQILKETANETRKILNELEHSPENLPTLLQDFTKLKLNGREDRLEEVANVIFDSAIQTENPIMYPAYANLVKSVCQKSAQTSADKFTRNISNQCQKEFQNSHENNKCECELGQDQCRGKRILRNTHFIGEFYKLKLFAPNDIIDFIRILLPRPDERSFESLQSLFAMIGDQLEKDNQLKQLLVEAKAPNSTSPIPKFVDNTFRNLKLLSHDSKLSPGIRSVLSEVVKLRISTHIPTTSPVIKSSRWSARKQNCNKTIPERQTQTKPKRTAPPSPSASRDKEIPLYDFVKKILRDFVKTNDLDVMYSHLRGNYTGDKICEFVNELAIQVSESTDEAYQKGGASIIQELIFRNRINKAEVIKVFASGIIRALPDIKVEDESVELQRLAMFFVELFQDEGDLSWLIDLGEVIEKENTRTWTDLLKNTLLFLQTRLPEGYLQILYRQTTHARKFPINILPDFSN